MHRTTLNRSIQFSSAIEPYEVLLVFPGMQVRRTFIHRPPEQIRDRR
jgi:hypothetical protein